MSIPIAKTPKITIYLVQPQNVKRELSITSENETANIELESNGLNIELFELELGINGTLLTKPKLVIVCGSDIAISKRDSEDFLTSDITLNDSQVAIIHADSDSCQTYEFVSRQFNLTKWHSPKIVLFKPYSADVKFLDSLMQTAKYSKFVYQRFLEVATNERTLVGKLSELLPIQSDLEEVIIPLYKK